MTASPLYFPVPVDPAGTHSESATPVASIQPAGKPADPPVSSPDGAGIPLSAEQLQLKVKALENQVQLLTGQCRLNAETIREQQVGYQAEIRQLHETIGRQNCELIALRGQQPDNAAQYVARVELLTFLLYESGQLVFDIDDVPVLIGTDRSEVEVRKVAAFITSLMCGPEVPTTRDLERWLRTRCTLCRNIECGHGDEKTQVTIPDRLTFLLKAAAQ